VLIRAQQKWVRISSADQPEAYVKRMILNQFLSWRRRRAAKTLPVPAIEPAAAEPDTAVRVVERHALLSQIAALPPKQRAVIALRYYEDMSDAQIAALLGCGEATVRSHCSRALAALRTSTQLTEASNDHR
jgi:RNA polymerase sigma factor (sigma-70 family)